MSEEEATGATGKTSDAVEITFSSWLFRAA